MPRLLGFIALIMLAVHAEAQTPRPRTVSTVEAQQYENALRSNPNDRAARGALLTYYFLGAGLDPSGTIQARRRHILWLIENAPEDPMAGGSAATIDPAGHRLADPEGFKLASDAWRARIARQDISANALGNAAFFFKLSDKAFTVSLLERALKMEPANQQLAGFLGAEYAMAILGVTMVNKNGFPTAADPRLSESAFAKQARQALDSSRNVYELAQAGYILSFQGAILRGSGQLAFDAGPLAESMLQRAVSLDPSNKGIAEVLAQHREIQAASAPRRTR